MRNITLVVAAIGVIALAVWICWYWMSGQSTSESKSFRMPIDDAFALQVPGKVVVTGRIADGEVRPGDRMKLKRPHDEVNIEVETIETFNSVLTIGRSGDNVGILIVGVTKEDIVAGSMLVR